MTISDHLKAPEGVHLSLLMNLEAKFRDNENRLLGENKAPFEFHTDVAMELVECPYAGSRHKHFKPMNVSALKQINNHWEEILNSFTCLRSFHISEKSLDQISLLDLYKLAIAGYLMPSYLFYKAKDAFADGELPAFVATIHKAALGLVNAAQVMLTKRLVMGRYKKDTVIDAENFYLFVENEKLFIGPWEVCAGTPNQIKELLKLLLNNQVDNSTKITLIPSLERYFHYITQAEKVVLLDNFFPVIFYFSLPENKLAKFFKILYPQGENSSVFANELSMELQFLDLVCPVLDERDATQKEKIRQDLVNIFSSVDEKENIIRLFNKNESEQIREQKYLEQAFKFFASDEIRISRKLAKNDFEIVIYILINYLLLERKKLSLYMECQREMNLVLERAEVSRPIDGIDITLMYDKKLRDILANFLAVEIDNFAEKTIIHQGLHKLILE
ncbi:MAG: hypothetical protein HY819_16750 [Acidobacteria bacterium]|nr:hypothetical protein [Acidobacteriota bacterium]